jgi:hypothetical protein
VGEVGYIFGFVKEGVRIIMRINMVRRENFNKNKKLINKSKVTVGVE